MSVRTSATIAAGICGGLFVAYCIYFDKKRRGDPKFKEKLRERKFSSDDPLVLLFNFTWLRLPRVYATTTSLLNSMAIVSKNATVTVYTVPRW